MGASEFGVGDRVRLKSVAAGVWLDDKLRRRAKAGRLATVRGVIGTALPPQEREYRIKFDAHPRERFVSVIVGVHDLERAP